MGERRLHSGFLRAAADAACADQMQQAQASITSSGMRSAPFSNFSPLMAGLGRLERTPSTWPINRGHVHHVRCPNTCPGSTSANSREPSPAPPNAIGRSGRGPPKTLGSRCATCPRCSGRRSVVTSIALRPFSMESRRRRAVIRRLGPLRSDETPQLVPSRHGWARAIAPRASARNG
jgi:hypothetical protein